MNVPRDGGAMADAEGIAHPLPIYICQMSTNLDPLNQLHHSSPYHRIQPNCKLLH